MPTPLPLPLRRPSTAGAAGRPCAAAPRPRPPTGGACQDWPTIAEPGGRVHTPSTGRSHRTGAGVRSLARDRGRGVEAGAAPVALRRRRRLLGRLQRVEQALRRWEA